MQTTIEAPVRTDRSTPPAPTATPARPRAGRLALLDGLRFVAAAGVVLYHFTAIHSSFWGLEPGGQFPRLFDATRYGNLGVQLFFFLSGFVILMSAWGRSIPQFVASRASRLFPAYWAGVLLTATLLVAAGAYLRVFNPLDTVTNLTMVQGAFGTTDVDSVYWTLWVELRFYLLIGLFLMWGITRDRVIAVALIWPVVGAVFSQYDDTAFSVLLDAYGAPFFAAGMLLYLVHREGWSPLLVLGIAFELALCITTVTGDMSATTEHTGAAPDPWVISLVLLGSFGLVALASTTRLQHLQWRWLSTAGLLTYPLYLVHQVYGLWIIKTLHPYVDKWVVLAVAIGATTTLAWAVHRWVERPFGPRLRRSLLRGLDHNPGGARPSST
ncbi:acyltransferase family protein [Nocardioides mangrovi]|uniref:Acyltransferase n=1 Tax=Nocardioides mangrovi TaxID=2874580 RepID=A0ABS7U8U7_9ACTN|nr:acyltransferase [Nocardioides mangrovi]MBZ5737393.1 acyltransferase [Nocardioides mangrovi]